MKLKLILLSLIYLCITLSGHAQTVSMQLKDEPLSGALKKLEQASGYRVLFTYDDVQAYRITATLHQTSVIEAIQKIINGKPLTYSIKDNQYIVIAPTSATDVFMLKGTVCDSIGTTITGATVILRQNEKVKTGAITNATGYYIVPNITPGEYQLSISFIGYETFNQTMYISNDTSFPPVVLRDGTIAIREVTIKGEPNPFRMKNGNIIADIAHSTLGKETDITEMLRKIPGMTLNYGQLVSFTGGTPAIYINGKKTLDMAEVKQLEIRNIKRVELITHPGAEYDSSISTVMLITTFNRQDGWSVQLDGSMSRNHYLSNEEGIKTNYRHGKLNLSGTFTYSDERRQSHQQMKTTIFSPDTLWLESLDMRTVAKQRTFLYSAGIEYDIDKHQSIGMQYNGSSAKDRDTSPIPVQVHANGNEYENLLTRSDRKAPEYRHHLNTYYNRQWTDKLSLNVYADYLRIHNRTTQEIDETSDREERNEMLITNGADYHLYAIGPKLTFLPDASQTFTLGAEWSRIDGKSFLSYHQIADFQSNIKNSEEKLAAYLSYSFRKGSFSLNAGMRYEQVSFHFDDFVDASQHIRRNEHDFFPNIGASYNRNGWSHSLSYRAGTIRPPFNFLNRSSYYMNRYLLQEGNPSLTPQYFHRFNYSFTWKDYLYASVGYTYNKDYIGGLMYTLSPHSPINCATWTNYDKQQQISALVNLHYRFGWYEPSLALTYLKNILKVPTTDGLLTVDKPIRRLRSENNFHLPHEWLIKAEYMYTSSGSNQFYTFRPTHVLNLTATKSFLCESLIVSLKGEDLLRKTMSLYDGRIGNIYFWQNEAQDIRSISLSVVYRFNNFTQKYKGKSAASDEMKRF